MGVLTDQLSVAVPASMSRAASNVSQSDTRPGLLAASETAPAVEQEGSPPLWSRGRMGRYEHGGYQEERSDGECREQMEAVGQWNDG